MVNATVTCSVSAHAVHCQHRKTNTVLRESARSQIIRFTKLQSSPFQLPSRHVSGMQHQHCSARAASQEVQEVTQQDRQYMQHALTLARKGLGKTFPNPAVGCLIVKQGKVIGEGYHPKAGEPHAEVFALRAAGQQAKGATAYVTLEPCNHYGKTPPCSQALVDAKVAKVFVGVRDPNPLVNNAGVDTLTRAGIDVAYIGGEEEKDCFDVNSDFMERMAPQ